MILLQIIANILLIWVLVVSAKKYKLNINIHNLPIVILFSLFAMLLNYLAIFSTVNYLLIGFLLSSINLIVNSVELVDKPNMTASEKLILSLITLVWWAQLIILIIFYMFNYKSITEHESI